MGGRFHMRQADADSLGSIVAGPPQSLSTAKGGEYGPNGDLTAEELGWRAAGKKRWLDSEHVR